MKSKLTLLSLLLTISIAFADDHATKAIDQIEFAIKAGNSGSLSGLIKHNTVALDKTLASLITAKGANKGHLSDATIELQQALDHAKLGHPGEAVSHSRTAQWHLKAVKDEK